MIHPTDKSDFLYALVVIHESFTGSGSLVLWSSSPATVREIEKRWGHSLHTEADVRAWWHRSHERSSIPVPALIDVRFNITGAEGDDLLQLHKALRA